MPIKMKTDPKSGDKVVPPPLESSKNRVTNLVKSINEVKDGNGEWISSKKVINHKTRQVETRIKRQIIMEDGKVIADSGPQITTRTKEDNWTEESENCAKKGCPVDAKSIGPIVKSTPVKIDKDHVVCEKIETKNTTREAKHERFQYHDESIAELTGYEIHQKALVSPNDLITINCDLVDIKKDIDGADFESKSVIDEPPKGKLTHYSSKSHKVTDKEEIKETSKLGVDGEIKTETVRTHHHEEVDDDEEPDEDEDSSKKSKVIKELAVNQLPEIPKEIEYSQNYETPIIQSNNEGNQRGHVDIKPIYDIGGRADHTTKWLESHFGSSDTSQKDKELSSSNGSAVDRRGRPRQRMNPVMSQSYDEAYYSRSNTYGENTNRSHSNLSKPSTDKFDCLTSPSPSPVAPIGTRKSTKKLKNHDTGYDKAVDSGNSNGTCTSSESSYYNGVDYHHSSEGSLSPSGHSYDNSQTFSKHQRCHCLNGIAPSFSDSLVNKRILNQSHDSKPVPINSNQHFIKSNHHHKNNNNNRNLIIRVKHRVSKEDASVQASLSDEEYNYDDNKETAKYGRNAIIITDVNKNVGGNTIVRPRPIKTYYFGEKVEPTVGSDCSNNEVDSNNNIGHGDKLFENKILPIECSFNSASYAYQGDPDDLKTPFIENGKFLTSPEHRRIINGSIDRLFNGSSRTDLFQTRDRGSLSNWRSTINLRSNGLATIDAPLTRSELYQSKDDSYKTTYRDLGFRANTFTRKHHGSANCLNERFKYDQIDDKLDSFGFHSSHRGLSPIQERKDRLNLRKVDLVLKDRSNGATRWPVLNSSSSKVKNGSSLYNGFDNYLIPREANSFRNRSTTLSYFKAH